MSRSDHQLEGRGYSPDVVLEESIEVICPHQSNERKSKVRDEPKSGATRDAGRSSCCSHGRKTAGAEEAVGAKNYPGFAHLGCVVILLRYS